MASVALAVKSRSTRLPAVARVVAQGGEDVEALIHESYNRLRGRLCGFVEACGLPQTQERGLIQTLKSLSYDDEAYLIEAVCSSKRD